ncbi:hypothetical protein MX587_12975 [Carnobacterium divergens]|nr:hypothetical protein [Carnobacterium divergens]MDT1964615.1 hypothetical protein [Carnobacterium divergens]
MFKNYTTNQVILPLDFSFQLEKNDIAFAIDQLIESILAIELSIVSVSIP